MVLTRDKDFLDTMPANMAVLFLDRVKSTPHREALRFPIGEAGWGSITWAETGDRVTKLAAGLIALGVEPEQRVAIASGTRYEWILADLAILCAGAATTTVYPTTNAIDTAYILGDSESQVVFVEDVAQLEKIQDHRAELGSIQKIVMIEPVQVEDEAIISLDDLMDLGEAHLAKNQNAVTDRADSIEPDGLATLIYTSGTTGRPKGVRLTHRAWVYEGAAARATGMLSEDDLQFLWLPLAHSFGKVLLSTQLACGFATAVDGRVDKIVENLSAVKPTFMGAAPRIFEKVYARIITMQQAEGGAKEKIFNRAFAVGKQVRQLHQADKPIPTVLGLQHRIFDKLVFHKIRERFGGRLRFFLSGSAALNKDIAEWFACAGIVILEGYGLTETSAGTTVNLPIANKIGTVGQVFPGTEARIGEDDEIQIKGPGVMQGYHNLPDATAQAFTEDGWLRTGDKGAIDAQGFLRITGRLKELFKTSGGKYVAPPMIEAKFKAICPYVSQFMVFGAERKFCCALVTLDPDSIATWATENGLSGDYEDIVSSPQVRHLVNGYIEELNATLNRWETIKKFAILDHDLSVESGEMTPSMKVKRGVVESNYASVIDDFYTG
jgi:long-chain acyl-CoA synthetase